MRLNIDNSTEAYSGFRSATVLAGLAKVLDSIPMNEQLVLESVTDFFDSEVNNTSLRALIHKVGKRLNKTFYSRIRKEGGLTIARGK